MGTTMEINKTGSGSSGGSVPVLIEKQLSVSVDSNATLYIPIDVGYEKYLVRTLYVTSDGTAPFVCSLSDKKQGGLSLYSSNEDTSVADILNIPSSDKDGGTLCHFSILNKSSITQVFTIDIRFTNLA